MMTHQEIASVLKGTARLPGVTIGEATPNADDAGYSAWLTINEAHFRVYVADYTVRKFEHDKNELVRAIAAPTIALNKLYDDGVADGRERERKAEIRALKEKQENAYRALRHQAMADAWNAIAATGEEK